MSSKFDFTPVKDSNKGAATAAPTKKDPPASPNKKEQPEPEADKKKTSPVKKDKEVTTLSNLTSPEKKSGHLDWPLQFLTKKRPSRLLEIL